jgi:UDP-N-acetylglucosamine--N-acetylmuramyl-(pentapeptide) pyrophosphoryl-undecaprenol N-acetylglucosamine transferase
MQKKIDVSFTGGHHNSALVLAKELKSRGFTVNWYGHKFTSKFDKHLSAEYQEVTQAGIDFFEIKTGKFYREFNPLSWLKIVFGFFQSLFYLLKYRPKLIYSSGGYISVPVVIAGFMLRIRSITHEQTVTAGWANRAISRFVDKILLTHPDSAHNYPSDKSVVVGLPLRPQLFDDSLKKTYQPPLLFIMCGKQGSHTINQALFPAIPDLVEQFHVVHQVGNSQVHRDLDRAKRIKDRLGDLSDRYQYAPYFFELDSASYLQSADVIVCRSGAHTAYEAIVLHKKAVLIPIPWVSHQEQQKNAQLVTKYTASTIVSEDQLTSESLKSAVSAIHMAKNKRIRHNLPLDADTKALQIIETYLV